MKKPVVVTGSDPLLERLSAFVRDTNSRAALIPVSSTPKPVDLEAELPWSVGLGRIAVVSELPELPRYNAKRHFDSLFHIHTYNDHAIPFSVPRVKKGKA